MPDHSTQQPGDRPLGGMSMTVYAGDDELYMPLDPFPEFLSASLGQAADFEHDEERDVIRWPQLNLEVPVARIRELSAALEAEVGGLARDEPPPAE